MATALVKGVATVGTLATAAGVGTAVYFNVGTTIADKLTSNGFKLIKNKDDYKFILFGNKNDKDFQTAIGKDVISHTDSGSINALKEWCETKLKAWATNNDSIYKNAKVWCVEPIKRTLGEKLGGTLLGNEAWAGKYTSIATGDGAGSKLFAALKDSFSTITFDRNTGNGGEKLKEWCVGVLKLKIYEVTSHKSEENIKEWCLNGAL